MRAVSDASTPRPPPFDGPPPGRAVTEFERASVLARLLEAWQAHPNLRLGQLLVCALGTAEAVFHVEDRALVDALRAFAASGEPPQRLGRLGPDAAAEAAVGAVVRKVLRDAEGVEAAYAAVGRRAHATVTLEMAPLGPDEDPIDADMARLRLREGLLLALPPDAVVNVFLCPSGEPPRPPASRVWVRAAPPPPGEG